MARTNFEKEYFVSVWSCVDGHFTEKPHWDRVELDHILTWIIFWQWLVPARFRASWYSVCNPIPRILEIEMPGIDSCSRSTKCAWDCPGGGWKKKEKKEDNSGAQETRVQAQRPGSKELSPPCPYGWARTGTHTGHLNLKKSCMEMPGMGFETRRPASANMIIFSNLVRLIVKLEFGARRPPVRQTTSQKAQIN